MNERPTRRWSLLPGKGFERFREREDRMGKWRAVFGWETVALAFFVLVIVFGQCVG